MSETTLAPTLPPALVDTVSRPLNRLVRFAFDLLAHIAGALSVNETAYLPKHVRADPKAGEVRVDTAAAWVLALTRTLAGSRFYLPPRHLKRALTARAQPPVAQPSLAQPAFTQQTPTQVPAEAPRPLPPQTAPAKPRPRPPLDADATLLKNMRHGFANRSIGAILRRASFQLGLFPGHDVWPQYLIEITETPLAWFLRHLGGAADQTAAPLPEHKIPPEPPLRPERPRTTPVAARPANPPQADPTPTAPPPAPPTHSSRPPPPD